MRDLELATLSSGLEADALQQVRGLYLQGAGQLDE
jgi:hypothetical protein